MFAILGAMNTSSVFSRLDLPKQALTGQPGCVECKSSVFSRLGTVEGRGQVTSPPTLIGMQ